MNKFLLRLIAAYISLSIIPIYTYASGDDDSQSELRQNPEMDSLAGQKQTLNRLDKYPFINLEANHIDMNGNDWSDIVDMFDESNHRKISILHIGDSHLQAEGATTVTRRKLQKLYGDAGRGLVIPFRLAGTNQPLDYKITSDTSYVGARLLKLPWVTDMGFTGISIEIPSGENQITLSSAAVGETPGFTFNEFAIFSNRPQSIAIEKITVDGKEIPYKVVTEEPLRVSVDTEVSELSVQFNADERLNIYGFDVCKTDATGVVYHVIGNNGATFSTYSMIGTEGIDVKNLLSPDLIIFSLGTNEAFGTITDEDFYVQIDLLVNEVRKANPDAKILLTTPAECQRSSTVTRKVKSKGKRGRRGKTTTVKEKVFAVNNNVVRLRNVILDYARKEGIPVYDWYEVAGGDGSSTPWVENKILNTDRIHCTWDGYRLQGELFFDALNEVISGERK